MKRTTTPAWVRIGILTLAATAANAGAGDAYTVDRLQDFGFGATPFDLNESGDTVGTVSTGLILEPAHWSGGGLPAPITPGIFGDARGISDNGMIVGNTQITGSAPYLFDGFLSLPIMTDGISPSASRVNNAGVVVGQSAGAAAIWTAQDGTRALTFGDATDSFGVARGLSNTGFAVGFTNEISTGFIDRAFRYDAGTSEMLDLGTLGGTSSQAFGVNEAGHVVGVSETSEGGMNPFLFADGQLIDLGNPELATISRAVAINNHGVIAGLDAGGGLFEPSTPWLWNNGVRTDLPDLVSLPDFLSIVDILDINDAGEILVQLEDSTTFTRSAAILRPVPAPGAVVTGALACAYAGSRRRRDWSHPPANRSRQLFTKGG